MSPPTPTSIALINGCYFDHLAPDPAKIDLDVIAAGLRQSRFNAQTIRLITIAEHSMRVCRIVIELTREWMSPEIRDAMIWALIHDAHEALVPWGDCLRPGKTDAMREVESAVDVCVCTAIVGWPCSPPDAVLAIVKTADDIALYFEAMLWGGPLARDWAPPIMLTTIETATMHDPDGVLVTEPGQLVEWMMPLVEPRPGECWRTEVEELLS